MHAELFFNYGDKAGEAHFLSWHQLRHRSYDLIASTKGNSLPYLDLTGEVTSDWLQRHAIRHATHRKLIQARTSHAVGLETVNWQSDTQRAGWLFQHALDHAVLDRFYGLP